VVTESLAHAHLAGTSFRPDRLQFIDDEKFSSLTLRVRFLILLVSFFVEAPGFSLNKIFFLFLEVVVDDFVVVLVLLLRTDLPLR
jgi:hypothetical protein